MFDALSAQPRRQTIFAVFIALVFATSGYEIIAEFRDGEPLHAMGDDLLRFLVSTAMLGAFIFEYRAQQSELGSLRDSLSTARGQLSQLDAKSQALASEYRGIMLKQFDVWQLTASEREIVTYLLKGLSFREIAEIRQTREKTVRQQASSVYEKAGVGSRHELAAWFFEDILDPPEQTVASGSKHER